MTQVVLPLAELACEACHAFDRWIRPGEVCACGWTSRSYRRKRHIAAYYAGIKAPPPGQGEKR